jgi:hypothetical protein
MNFVFSLEFEQREWIKLGTGGSELFSPSSGVPDHKH